MISCERGGGANLGVSSMPEFRAPGHLAIISASEILSQ